MKRLLIASAVLIYCSFTNAQVPGTLSYQGILVTAAGAPVTDGNHNVTFNFYTVSTGGSPAFSRGQFTVTTYKGMFTFLLGTGSPAGNDALPVQTVGSTQYFVELVADGVTLSPRVQLTSVPYAFKAESANSVDAFNITTGTLSDARLESTVDINTLNVGGIGQFNVNSGGNITKLNNISISFPSGQGGPNSFLSNDGSGNLSWSTISTIGWSLTGNSGTSDANNFIGTTDNVPFNIRVNGQKAGGINYTLANAFYGLLSGSTNTTGSFNTAAGRLALGSNTTGSNNVATGASALNSNATGSNNTAIGENALYSNVSGTHGVAIGSGAMYYSNNSSSTFTNYNVAVGHVALRGSVTSANNTGNYNTTVGSESLFNNATGNNNTALGYQTLFNNTSGSSNVAIGNSALLANTTGSNNCASGFTALSFNTLGNANTAYGDGALLWNVAGSFATAIGAGAMYYANNTASGFSNSNVAVGYQALRGSETASANTGMQNTGLGYQTLVNNSSGNWNTATGTSALTANTTGSLNVGVGGNALYTSTTGNYNIAVGYGTLYSNTSGSGNVAIGYQAGYTTTAANANTTGTNNIFIGNNAGPGTSTQLTNATAIGNGTTVDASDKVRIGNSSVTVIEGQVSFTNSSDKRLKTEIKNLSAGMDFISQLKPVSYKMRLGDRRTNWGFIAQDIENILGTGNAILTVGGDSDRTLGLRYTDFIAPMVKALQELAIQNSKLENQVADQQKTIEQQNELLENLLSKVYALDNLNEEISELRALIKPQINSSPSKSEFKK